MWKWGCQYTFCVLQCSVNWHSLLFYFSIASPLFRQEDSFGCNPHTHSGRMQGRGGASCRGPGSLLLPPPPAPALLKSSLAGKHWQLQRIPWGLTLSFWHVWSITFLSTVLAFIPVGEHSQGQGAKRKFPVADTLWDIEGQVSTAGNGAVPWPLKEG